jgi:hypothetical protein
MNEPSNIKISSLDEYNTAHNDQKAEEGPDGFYLNKFPCENVRGD